MSVVAMQALEKISHEHPAACLRSGGLLASLSYLDFFQTGVQRVAVATAANMCRCVTSEHTEAVASAIPMLTNLLQYQVSIKSSDMLLCTLRLSIMVARLMRQFCLRSAPLQSTHQSACCSAGHGHAGCPHMRLLYAYSACARPSSALLQYANWQV